MDCKSDNNCYCYSIINSEKNNNLNNNNTNINNSK